MVELIWAFAVKRDARGQFELMYGPGGAWSNLFADRPGFRGITVLRDAHNLRRYLTIEVWDDPALRASALAEQRAEYAQVQAVLNVCLESMTEVGAYHMLPQAAVRPRGGRQRAR